MQSESSPWVREDSCFYCSGCGDKPVRWGGARLRNGRGRVGMCPTKRRSQEIPGVRVRYPIFN